VREVKEVVEVLPAMRCMLLCMLEAVEGGLCLREVSEVLEVLKVMRCMLLCMLEAMEGRFKLLRVGGDALYAILYAGGGGGGIYAGSVGLV